MPADWPSGVISLAPMFLPTCSHQADWRKRKSSARCCRSCAPPTWTKPCAIANDTDDALTAGIFSRSPAAFLEPRFARESFQAGNVYLNRSITGALVNRQPFGGFKLSGIGDKAGGPDYLLQFVVERTITENTLRRGFAPPAADGE